MDEFLDVQLMFLVDGGWTTSQFMDRPPGSHRGTVTPAEPFSDRSSIHEITTKNHITEGQENPLHFEHVWALALRKPETPNPFRSVLADQVSHWYSKVNKNVVMYWTGACSRSRQG